MAALRTRRGSQAMEFALVLPVFLALVSAIVDYGWYFHQLSLAMNVVRDATRQGSMTDQATAEQVACDGLRSAGLISGTGATCAEVSTTVTGTAPDEILTVSASVAYTPLFGLVPIPVTLAADLAMHVES